MPLGFIPFPLGTVQVHLNFLLNGLPAQTSFGIRRTDGSAASAAQGLAACTLFSTWWLANVKAYFYTANSLNNIVAIDLTSESGWEVSESIGISGTGGGSQLTAQAALVVTAETGIRGRSYRGRNYWPGIPASYIASSTYWGATIVTAYNTAHSALVAPLTAGGWTQVVLSRILNKVPRTLGHTQDVLYSVAKSPIATIRGRLT